jgi:hypothetical protein
MRTGEIKQTSLWEHFQILQSENRKCRETDLYIIIENARKNVSLLLVTAVWWKNGYFKAKNRSTFCVNSASIDQPTILVKNVGALDTDCAKFDSHINNKHNNPPFPRSMLCVVFYTSKVLHNIDKGDRWCLDLKFCIKWASMYMVIRNEVKVMLFRLSAPRIFDQDCLNVHYLTILILFHKNTLALILEWLVNL